MPLNDNNVLLGNPAPEPEKPFLGSPEKPAQGPNPIFPNVGRFDNPSSAKANGGLSLEELHNPRNPSNKRISSTIIPTSQLLENQRYKYYSPFDNNEEIYAAGQSVLDKFGNGLAKMGVTAVGTFLQGFLTIPDTISAIKNGRMSDLYNSDAERSIDNWLKNIEDIFPNYYSAEEQEHPFLSAIPFTSGSANFWADKVIKNLGFTIGAIGSAVAQDALVGVITGGIGEAPLLGSQIGKASLWLNKIFTGTDKVADVLSTARGLGATGESLMTAKNLANIAQGIKVKNAAQYAMNLYGSARTEAGVEAREGYNTTRAELIETFKEKNGGITPQGRDLEAIESYATSASNARFGINMALLTVSNAVQFENFLKPFTTAKKGATLANGSRITANTIDTVSEVVPTTRMGKVWGGFKPQIKNILSEGVYEEGGQYAAQVGSANYYKSRYDKDPNRSAKGSVNEVLQAAMSGLEAQFGTTEGLENMFLGAITGGLFGVGGNLVNKARGIEDNSTDNLVKEMNRHTLTGSIARNYDDTVKAAEIGQDMEAAVANNDLFQFKNLKHDLFYNYIASATQAGRFDVRLEQLNMLKDLSKEEFEKMFSIEDNQDGRKTVDSYVDKLIEKATDIKRAQDNINSVFVNPIQLSSKSTPEQINDYNTFEDWKNVLGYYSSFEKDSNDRIQAIQTEVGKMGNISVDDLRRLGSAKGLKAQADLNKMNIDWRNSILATSNPEEKLKTTAEIQFLEKQNQRIDEFLKTGDSNAFAEVFLDQLTYNANGQTLNTTNSIPKDTVGKLAEFAKDLGQLEDRKTYAKRSWDALTSRNGLERFAEDKAARETAAMAESLPEEEKQTVKVKTATGEKDIQLGGQYYVGGSAQYDKNGNRKMPISIFTAVAVNPDGTIQIKDNKGNIRNITPEELEGMKVSSVESVRKNKKASWFMKNMNKPFIMKVYKGKTRRGYLSYSNKDGILTFDYFSENGKLVSTEVTGDQFVAKEGYKEAQITPTEPYTAEEQTEVEALGKEKDDRKEAKRAGRMGIIAGLINDSYERLDLVLDNLKRNEEELKDAEARLERAQAALNKQGATPTGKFKTASKATLNALSTFSRIKAELLKEQEFLLAEQDELEFNIGYFHDLTETLDELPTGTNDFIEEIKNQNKALEDTVVQNGLAITQLNKLIGKVDSALQGAIDMITDLMDKFTAKYGNNTPTTIFGQEFIDFRNANPDFVQESGALSRLIDQLDDVDIKPNERLIVELNEKIQDLYKENNELEKILRAKSVVVDLLEDAVKKFRDNKKLEEKLKNDEAFRKAFFADQAAIAKESGKDTPTNSVEDDIANTKPESRKKRDTELFTTTIGISEDDPNPSETNLQQRHFLNNVSDFANPEELRVVFVHKNNEDVLKVTGLTKRANNGFLAEDQLTNEDNGMLVAAYARQTPEGVKFIDYQGNVTEDVSKIIFSTMPSTSLTSQYNGKNEPRYREGQEESAKAQQVAWRAKRKEIFASASAPMFKFSVSRGIGQFGAEVKGVVPEQHVTTSLVPEEALADQGLIKLSQGIISHQGNNVNFPKGRPVLQYKDTLQFINNRRLNSKEQEKVFDLLVLLTRRFKEAQKANPEGKGTLDRQITGYLQNILYWGKYDWAKAEVKPVGRNQLFINQEFRLEMGNNEESFEFSENALLANKTKIMGFLGQVYNNVNGKTLKEKFSEPFEEIVSVEGDKIISRQWPTYQEFLLAAKYPDGSARKIEDTPLSTSIRPINDAVPYDTNFKQKYAILEGLELNAAPVQKKEPAAQPVKKEAAKQEPASKPPAAKEAATVKDDKNFPVTETTFTTGKGVVLTYEYGMTDGKVNKFSMTEDENYKAVHDKLMNIKTEAHPNGMSPEEATDAIQGLISGAIEERHFSQPNAQTPAATPAVVVTVVEPETPGEATPSLDDIILPDEEAYSRVGSYGVNRMTADDLAAFKEWHAKNVPNIPFEVLEHLIQVNPNKQAWGVFENGVAKFYKSAERGTEYHEIFEAVWASFLSPNRRAEVLAEFKSNKGTFIERETGNKIQFSEATDQQAKERIADDFAKFRLGELKAVTLKDKILKFFRDIVNFFKKFIGNPSLKDSLFRDINTGAFKNSALIVNTSLAPEYSAVRNLSEKATHEAVQDITARVFSSIFGSSNKNLYNIEAITDDEIFAKIKQQYIDQKRYAIIGEEGWNQLLGKVKSFLRTFQIEFDEAANLSINTENANKNEYSPEPFTVNVKRSSPWQLKMLFATAVRTQRGESDALGLTMPKPQFSTEWKGFQLVNFAKSFVTVMDRLSNTTDPDAMAKKLYDLAVEDGDYARIFARLGGRLNGEGAGTIDYKNLSPNDWRMLLTFYKVFSKQGPEAIVMYKSGTEGTTLGTGDLYNTVNQIVTEWAEGMKVIALSNVKDRLIIKTKEGYEINNAAIKAMPVGTPAEQVEFLKKLSIPFSTQMYFNMNADQRKKFNDAVAAIKTYLGKSDILLSLKGKTLGINSALKDISELYVRATVPIQDSSFYDVNGKLRQIFINNNPLSHLATKFNEVKTLDELKEAYPQLNDVYSTNSQVLKLGGQFFDKTGKRTDKKFSLKYAHGSLNSDNGKGTSTNVMTYPDRIMFEFSNNLNGDYYVLVPADASTEWMMQLGNTVSFSEFSNMGLAWNNIYNVFTKYLQDEIALATEDRSHLLAVGNKTHNLRFFGEILKPTDVADIQKAIAANKPTDKILERDSVKAAIKDWLTDMADRSRQTLASYGKIENKGGTYAFPELFSRFANRYELNKYALAEKDLDAIMLFRTVNYAIANMEYHKVIFGDPFQFDIKQGGKVLDETKRIKLWTSPRDTTHSLDVHDEVLNNTLNKGLTPTDPGYKVHSPILRTSTITDVMVVGSTAINDGNEDYAEVNEADAGSLLMDTAWREAKLKNGQFSDQAAQWFEWQMAYTRKALAARGAYDSYPTELMVKDALILSYPKPEYTLEILKPIVSGNKANKQTNEQVVDKFSQMPMFFSMFPEGSRLQDLYIKMWKEKIDYVVVKSGRKVGREKMHSVYNADGSFNNEPFNNLIEVPWTAWSILVETAHEAGKRQTRGSQITKLVTLDLMRQGEVYNPDNKLTPEQVAKTKELVEKNQRILNEMTQNGYKNLLKKLGIEDLGGSFVVLDKSKARETIRQELLKREMADNIVEVLELDPQTGEFLIPFEASAAYIQIRNVFYSIVDKNITSPKMNGAPHVQVPSTLWETEDRGLVNRVKNSDGTISYNKLTKEQYEALEDKSGVSMTSNSLKWYTKEEPWIEVMLPHWFKSALKGKLKDMSDDDILYQLNGTEEGKKILSGIGFRIPTDALHAAENFRIKGFLSQDMGYSIVVPSEITVKAGSDFDIDKLNTYLKNVYVDQKGKIRLVPYFESVAAARKFLNDNAFAELLNVKNILDDANGIDTLEDIDFIPSAQEASLDDKAQMYYAQGLENEYFESMREIMELPQNYDRLLKPTTNGELEDLAKELDKAKNNNSESLKARLLDSNYMSSLRHAFLTGKAWVGIGAVHNTGHSLKQRTTIFIDAEKIKALPEDERQWFGSLQGVNFGRILLDHNKDAQGRISLSEVTDTEGKYISDKLSAYLNASVDVAKDPFILRVIKSTRALSTFLFLEEAGVPTRQIALFMNQPIIEKYLDLLESEGTQNLFNAKRIESILEDFPSYGGTTKLDIGKLKGNIETYAKNGELNDAGNKQQKLILMEFLKYAKMAEHNFAFNQASNYDTASFRSGYDIAKKDLATQNSSTNIISSPETVLAGSHIGEIRNALLNVRKAFGNFFKLEDGAVGDIIDQVMLPYNLNKYMSADDFQNVSTRVVTSFIDYLLQTKGRYNNGISKLMLEYNSSFSRKLEVMKMKYPSNELLRNLTVVSGDTELSSKNIKFKIKLPEAYDQNLYTGYWRELRSDPATNGFYKDLVRVAILQGTSFSPFSMTNIVPVEDFSAILAPIIKKLGTYENLTNFAKLHMFQRANWRNNDVVPEVTPKFYALDDELQTDPEERTIYSSKNFPALKSLNITAKSRKVLLLAEQYNAGTVNFPIVKVKKIQKIYNEDDNSFDQMNILTGRSTTARDFAIAKERGDDSFKHVIGYRRVQYADGTPLKIPRRVNSMSPPSPHYVYVQTNLWGDGKTQEYYDEPRQSQIDNQTHKTEEMSDTAIINHFDEEAAEKAREAEKDKDAMLQIDPLQEFKDSLKRKDC